MQSIFGRLSSRLTGSLLGATTPKGCAVLSKLIPSSSNSIVKKYFGILSTPMKSNSGNSLLKPATPLVNQVCGIKIKERLKLRCKFCYFVTRQETLYVMCSSKPKHQQQQRRAKPFNMWILTHATQGKVRPW